jgi:hypothetical protein
VPTGPTTFAATLPDQTVNGLFVDTFELLPSTFAGSVSVSLMSVAGPSTSSPPSWARKDSASCPRAGRARSPFRPTSAAWHRGH